MRGLVVFAVAVACLILACGGTSQNPQGEENRPCYGNGTCNEGLSCSQAKVCVRVVPDPCEGVVCSGHGLCAVADDTPICVCEAGYHAEASSCVEDPPGPCYKIGCSGHGKCVVSDTGVLCYCDAGFHPEELSCVRDSGSPCEAVTCSGHGQCVIAGDAALCYCDNGYHTEGLQCLADALSPCSGVTCGEHGACAVSSDGSRALCVCDPGFHAEALDCVPDPGRPCEDVTCSEHGKCVLLDNEALCYCDSGYHAEGLKCVEDIPGPCADVTCGGHGACAVADTGALCVCDSGFHAEALDCVQDPPDPCEGVPCSNHGACAVSDPLPLCVCDSGYHAEGLDCIQDPACTVRFTEDFDDGDAEGWRFEKYGYDPGNVGWTVEPNGAGFRYRGTGGTEDGSGQSIASYSAGVGAADFKIEADVTLVKHLNPGAVHGIVARYTVSPGGESYYMCVVRPFHAMLMRVHDGIAAELLTEPSIGFPEGSTFRMGVEVIGSTFRCTFDGSRAIEVQDSILTVGNFGLTNAGGTTAFDNVVVSACD